MNGQAETMCSYSTKFVRGNVFFGLRWLAPFSVVSLIFYVSRVKIFPLCVLSLFVSIQCTQKCRGKSQATRPERKYKTIEK